MNRLLHSRVFKKNLAKWIFMYIVTLAFFTSVVTYSKYFSSLASNDNARPAKFNIKIDYLGENLEDIDCKASEVCLTSNKVYAPGDIINYYFKVDTKELEVKTIVNVTVNLKDVNFKIVDVKVKNVNDKDFVKVEDYGGITPDYDMDKMKNYFERVNAGKGEEKIYKIAVKFNGFITNNNPEYDLYTVINKPKEIITVDYSARQIID